MSCPTASPTSTPTGNWSTTEPTRAANSGRPHPTRSARLPPAVTRRVAVVATTWQAQTCPPTTRYPSAQSRLPDNGHPNPRSARNRGLSKCSGLVDASSTATCVVVHWVCASRLGHTPRWGWRRRSGEVRRCGSGYECCVSRTVLHRVDVHDPVGPGVVVRRAPGRADPDCWRPAARAPPGCNRRPSTGRTLTVAPGGAGPDPSAVPMSSPRPGRADKRLRAPSWQTWPARRPGRLARSPPTGLRAGRQDRSRDRGACSPGGAWT